MKILKISIILLIPILLVLGSVRLLVTDQYLAWEYSKASFPKDPFGFDLPQRLTYASANFRYVRENQPADALAEQRLGELPLYNERELKHMNDVQDVYQAAWRTWQIAFGLFALAVLRLIWRRETRPELGIALAAGGLLTAGLIAITGFLAIAAWQVWFVAFHQVFFAPGTWTFSPSDTLIRLFPEKFWFDAALTISGASLVGGLFFALIGKNSLVSVNLTR
jgi:integral membrane protein (TIGR01906 family)